MIGNDPTQRPSSAPHAPHDSRSAWAREALGLPADATADDACARLVEWLEDESEFVPPESWTAACATLRQPSHEARHAPDPDPYVEHQVEVLRRDADQFAREFFSLPLDERLRRWIALSQRCDGFAQPALRVAALGSGLKVVARTAAADDPPCVQELADLACELFTLAPRDRAVRRERFLIRVESEGYAPWSQAAVFLRRTSRDVADLAPDVVQCLADWAADVRRGERMQLQYPVPNCIKFQSPVETPSIKSRITGTTSGWPVGVAVVIILAIVRAFLPGHVGSRNPWDHPRRPAATSDIPKASLEELILASKVRAALVKSDDELTDDERRCLISLGFDRPAEELTADEESFLTRLDLVQPSIEWRASHDPARLHRYFDDPSRVPGEIDLRSFDHLGAPGSDPRSDSSILPNQPIRRKASDGTNPIPTSDADDE